MLGLEVEQLTGRSTSTSSPSSSRSPSIGNGSSRRTFSYSKLPEDTLNLSIRKLDGSSFDVEVLKSATVADLKLGVQNVFSHMPNDGPQNISWEHVWGHFCLCYRDQKLVNDSDHIIKYGIKDADQLQFIRHVSITCTNSPKIRKTRRTISQNHSYMKLSNSLEDEFNDEDADDYYHEVQKGCQFDRLWSSCSKIKRMGSSKSRGCRSTCVFL